MSQLIRAKRDSNSSKSDQYTDTNFANESSQVHINRFIDRSHNSC